VKGPSVFPFLTTGIYPVEGDPVERPAGLILTISLDPTPRAISQRRLKVFQNRGLAKLRTPSILSQLLLFFLPPPSECLPVIFHPMPNLSGTPATAWTGMLFRF